MLRGVALILFTVMLGSGCGAASRQVEPRAADLQTIKRMAVVVTGDDSFRVVAERAEGPGTKALAGAAVGGLLGYALVGGFAAEKAESKDRQTAKALLEHLNGFTPHRAFAEAFAQALQDSGRSFEVMVLERDPGASDVYDAVAEFRIEEWGIRRVIAEDAARLAGFVKLKARVARTTSADPMWREWDTVLGQGRYDLATYRADGETLRKELREVATDAGHRMAMKMLYPKEASK